MKFRSVAAFAITSVMSKCVSFVCADRDVVTTADVAAVPG